MPSTGALMIFLFGYLVGAEQKNITLFVDKPERSCSRVVDLRDTRTQYSVFLETEDCIKCQKADVCTTLQYRECKVEFVAANSFLSATYKICYDKSPQNISDCSSRIKYEKQNVVSRNDVLELLWCENEYQMDSEKDGRNCLDVNDSLIIWYNSYNYCDVSGFTRVYLWKNHSDAFALHSQADCPNGQENVRGSSGRVISHVDASEEDRAAMCEITLIPDRLCRDYKQICFTFEHVDFPDGGASLFFLSDEIRKFNYDNKPYVDSEYCMVMWKSRVVRVAVEPSVNYSYVLEDRYLHAFSFNYYFKIREFSDTSVLSGKEDSDIENDTASRQALALFFLCVFTEVETLVLLVFRIFAIAIGYSVVMIFLIRRLEKDQRQKASRQGHTVATSGAATASGTSADNGLQCEDENISLVNRGDDDRTEGIPIQISGSPDGCDMAATASWSYVDSWPPCMAPPAYCDIPEKDPNSVVPGSGLPCQIVPSDEQPPPYTDVFPHVEPAASADSRRT
ncbi:uncharacterized protein LOC101853293 [Aplysia californica]|uniref:Uncharacterized protein LOC101853293 n=1 Tax=Aplysia californica TaxID=6500 RepID=A0ABM0JEM8_APLCA|nr:uncharacterized protein LOC101853293 [Aplysia californica]XP_012946950.1 uncharacterized protein LOC101853293 [Aplysia californica]